MTSHSATAFLPQSVSWEQWGQLFTDTAAWLPAIHHVWSQSPELRRLAGQTIPMHIQPGYPGTCAVFTMDTTAVIKFFPPFAHEDFDRERAVLERLGYRLPLVPHLLSDGVLRDRTDWPYLVLRYDPGSAWRDLQTEMSDANRRAVCGELAAFMREIHHQPIDDGPEWPSQTWWPRLVAQRTSDAPEELARLTSLSATVLHDASALLEGFDWPACRPCLVHADLTEDHLLLQSAQDAQDKWHLSRVIDWADAEVADVMYDWVALWFSVCHRDAGLFRDFLEAYDPAIRINAEFVRGLLAFTLLHRFGPLIISDVLPESRQRRISSLAELEAELFPGLV